MPYKQKAKSVNQGERLSISLLFPKDIAEKFIAFYVWYFSDPGRDMNFEFTIYAIPGNKHYHTVNIYNLNSPKDYFRLGSSWSYFFNKRIKPGIHNESVIKEKVEKFRRFNTFKSEILVNSCISLHN